MDEIVFRIVFGVIFGLTMLLGVFVLLATVALFFNVLRSVFWPTAVGTITSSTLQIQDRSAGRTAEGTDHVTHSARITYTYEVDGRTFEGSKVHFENLSSGSLVRSQRVVHAYPEGAQVAVFHHPTHPELAVLHRGLPPGFFGAFLFGVLATVVGGKAVLIAIGVLPFHLSEALALGCVVGALIGVGLVCEGVRVIRMGLASRDWPTIPAEVIRSTVLTMQMDSGSKTRYAPDIAYRYEVDGREYTSHEIRAGSKTWSSRKSAERSCEFYPVGKTVDAHVNPVNPADAVLVPGADWVAGALIVVGMALLAGAFFVARMAW
jgi:hypothetical protein